MRSKRVDALRGGFELQSKLTALPAKGFQLLMRREVSSSRRCDSRSSAAMRSSACVMRLRTAEAVRDRLQDCVAALLLLLLDFDQRGRAARSFLLPLLQFLLRVGHIGIGRLQSRAVRFQLLLQARQLLFGVGDLGLRSGGARIEFGTTLFVGAATRGGAIQVQSRA